MSGLPLGAIVGHPQALLTQQQLAARAGTPAGQQMRAAAGNAAAVAAAAAAAAAAADARRLAGKKRKALEKPASEKALHLVPESPLFNSLVMQEHYLDDLIKRQRLELQAAVNPLECPVHKRLRVYIFNTHRHQQGASAGSAQQQGAASSSEGSSASSSEPPQWTLAVWGRLENPDPPTAPKPSSAQAGTSGAGSSAAAGTGSSAATAAAAAGGSSTPGEASTAAQGAADGAAGKGGDSAAAAPAPPINVSTLPPQPAAQHGSSHKQYPFTGFFKRIEFKLDPEQYPDSTTSHVTWEKLLHRGPHKDRMEIKRVGSQPTNVTITFQQDFAPPVYKVDQRLAEVLGMTFGQQQMVMTRLYSYIITATQQVDLTQLQLDDKLEPIFGTKQLPSAALPQALGRLLQPLEPVTVTHTITTSGPSPGPVTCVDFDVLLPVKMQDKIAPVFDPLLEDKQFEALDQKVDASLAKLFEARRRRDLYLGFAEDPVAFLNTIIASQARELRVSRNNQAVAIERRTDLFRDKWVEEAALRYLGRQSKQEGMFPGIYPGQGFGGS